MADIEPEPNPNTVPSVEECLANSARMLRGAEMREDATHKSIDAEIANRWMELGAVIHGISTSQT